MVKNPRTSFSDRPTATDIIVESGLSVTILPSLAGE